MNPPMLNNQQQTINDCIINKILPSNNALVSCQLIACKSSLNEKQIASKESNNDIPITILSKIYYKPSIIHKKVDLSMKLLSLGKAMINDDNTILPRCHEENSESIKYYNSSTMNLKRDGEYMDTLAKLEYDAFVNRRGIWIDRNMHELRKDLVLEEEEERSSVLTKILKFIKSYLFR